MQLSPGLLVEGRAGTQSPGDLRWIQHLGCSSYGTSTHSEKDAGRHLYCHPCHFLFLCLFLILLSWQAVELLLGVNFSLSFTSCVTMKFSGLSSSPYLLNRGQDPSLSSGMRPGGESTDVPHFIVLSFTALQGYCIFL